jgi:amidase
MRTPVRRSLAFVTAALLALGVVGAAPPGVAAAGRPATDTRVAGIDVDALTIPQLQALMNDHRLNAVQLATFYLNRIRSLQPKLHAVIKVSPTALADARRADAQRRAGDRRPLLGIPVLVKDNVGTADRMNTTAGSLALLGATPAADAFLVRKLRDAGAVLLGKTNLSEWANFRSTHSSSGWSGRGGQCRNPYALDRNPSGSSSGSGAAVAASLAAAAIGSETDGSIVSPSNNCGLVGIKPTLGLVSRTGIIPIAHSQDTAGPMSRTVVDAAILLTAIAGPDPQDAATKAVAGKPAVDYARLLEGATRLDGVRIGVPRKKLFGQSPSADALVEAALGDLKKLGAVIVDPADIATLGETDDSEFEVLLYEFKADLNAYLAGLGGKTPYRTLKDLIRFNEENRDREMPYFGQEIFEKAEAKGPLTDKAYVDALEKDLRLTRKEGIDKTMDDHKLDALVAPTSGPASLIDLVNGDYGVGGSSSFPAIAGYPDVTVPCGFFRGLPVGMSIFGRPWSEPVLLKIAYVYEQATKHRKAPRFLPTADLSAKA